MADKVSLQLPSGWGSVPFGRMADVMGKETSKPRLYAHVLGVDWESMRNMPVNDFQRLLRQFDWVEKPPEPKDWPDPLKPFKVAVKNPPQKPEGFEKLTEEERNAWVEANEFEEWEVIADLQGAPLGLWFDLETDLESNMPTGEKTTYLIGRSLKPVGCEPYQGYSHDRAREVAREIPSTQAVAIADFFGAAGTLFAQLFLIYTGDEQVGNILKNQIADLGGLTPQPKTEQPTGFPLSTLLREASSTSVKSSTKEQ